MLKTHLIGIIKIQKNSVWHQHHSYYREIIVQATAAAAATKSFKTFKTTTRKSKLNLKLLKLKKNCRCLRKRRKFHIRKIQNLWFGSNVYHDNNNK